MTNDRLARAVETLTTEVASLRRRIELLENPPDRSGPIVDNEPLYEALIEWRREQAAKEGVPPYRVFGNATLASIAVARPADSFELSRVKGVGPDKLERYRDTVLAIVASHSW